MSSFTEPLIVQKLSKNRWLVHEGFRYYVGAENSSEYIDVPKGFATDFASVPRGLWNLIPPDGQYAQAAVLHDWLYSIRYQSDRKKCDDIFLEAMAVLNVPEWKRYTMYYAVRAFGWIAW